MRRVSGVAFVLGLAVVAVASALAAPQPTVSGIPRPALGIDVSLGRSAPGQVKIDWSVHKFGSPRATGSVVGTINVTGSVKALSQLGITVDGQTCPVEPTSTVFLLPVQSGPATSDPVSTFLRLRGIKGLRVGVHAHMTCTVFSNGQSNDSISY